MIKLQLSSVPTELLEILLLTSGRLVFNLFYFTTIHHLPSQARDSWGFLEMQFPLKKNGHAKGKKNIINFVRCLCLPVDE